MYFELDEEQKAEKTEKEFKELMIQLEASKRKFSEEMQDTGIDLEQLSEYFNNQENFTETEWQLIQEKRTEVNKKLLDNEDHSQRTTSSHRDQIGKGWVFC